MSTISGTNTPDRDFERYADDPSGSIVAGLFVSDGLVGGLEIAPKVVVLGARR